MLREFCRNWQQLVDLSAGTNINCLMVVNIGVGVSFFLFSFGFGFGGWDRGWFFFASKIVVLCGIAATLIFVFMTPNKMNSCNFMALSVFFNRN